MKKIDATEFLPLSWIAKIPGLVFCKDCETKYVWCNGNYANLIGLNSYVDIIGKTDFDLELNRLFIELSIIDDQKILWTGTTIENEYQLLSKIDSNYFFYLKINKTPLYDDNYNIIGIMATALDITKERLEIEKKSNAFESLQDIFYNLPGLIYWKNLALQYIGFNKNVVNLSGLSKEELMGKDDLELNWGRWEADSFQKNDQEIIMTGVSKTTEYEVPIKRLDGHYMTVKTVKSPLIDKQGHIIGILAVAIDITEQKILENDLIDAKNKIERLNQIKTDFIRNMEHDIRTPFTGINTLAALLEETEIDRERKKLLSAINQSSKELLDYCNTILDFSRIDMAFIPMIEKRFVIEQLINRVIHLEKAAIEEKKHRFKIIYDDNLIKTVIGDSYRIERILINLVSNAIKFTPPQGSLVIHVKLGKIISDRYCIVKFLVKDNGIGFSEDKIPQIFETFNRLTLSNQGQYKGVGLGLSIVKNLVTDLDGDIEVESEIGKGSSFIVTLLLKIPLLDN